MHKLKTTLIFTFFLSFFSTSLNAQSLYWTDTVNEKLENLQTFDKNLAIATKLVNASVSKQCNKKINDDDMLKINKIYALKIQKITTLLNDKNNSAEYKSELESIECVIS